MGIDAIQRTAKREAVVQRLIGDAVLVELSFGPFAPVQAQLHTPWRVAADFDDPDLLRKGNGGLQKWNWDALKDSRAIFGSDGFKRQPHGGYSLGNANGFERSEDTRVAVLRLFH